MKKEVLIVLLLCISFVAAEPTLTLNKNQFISGETATGVISGDFEKEISSSDISFFEGQKQISLDYGISQYNKSYYIYFIADKQGNYTIKISNILYRDEVLKGSTIVQNFSVQSGKVLGVSPGIIFTSSKQELTLKNPSNVSINVSYSFESKTSTISIAAGSEENIEIIPTLPFSYINITSNQTYSLPVIYVPLSTQEKDREIQVIPSFMKVELKIGQNITKPLVILNLNKKPINFTLSKNADFVSLGNFSNTIEANGSVFIELTFNAMQQGDLLGNLTIRNTTIPLELLVFEQNATLPVEQTNSNNTSQEQTFTCDEIGGKVCFVGQTCQGSAYPASDGLCCVGSCLSSSSPDGTGYGWLIGVIIIAVLGAAGYFIYKKVKKSPSKAENPIQKKSELYEKRVSGNLSRN